MQQSHRAKKDNKTSKLRNHFLHSGNLTRNEILILVVITLSGITGSGWLLVAHHANNPNDQSTSQSQLVTESTKSSKPQKQSPKASDATNNSSSASTKTLKNTVPTDSDPALKETKLKIYQTMCIDPLRESVDKWGAASNSANSQAWSSESAISYSPGTEQYRSAYNSIAFARNFNIELAYSSYLSDVKIMNKYSNCDITPARQSYSYWKMIDADGNYVPYTEGSSLPDYN